MNKYSGNERAYLNQLYGKILYVLQINSSDLEFDEYRKFILDLKKVHS